MSFYCAFLHCAFIIISAFVSVGICHLCEYVPLLCPLSFLSFSLISHSKIFKCGQYILCLSPSVCSFRTILLASVPVCPPAESL